MQSTDGGSRGDEEDIFRINQESFESDFRNLYEGRFQPRYLVQFSVLLPYCIPVSGAHFTTFPSATAAHTFLFDQVQATEEVPAGVLSRAQARIPVGRTRVEMALVTADDTAWRSLENEEIMSLMEETFGDLLRNVNVVLTAYLLSTSDVSVYRVTREMIGFVYFGRLVHLGHWADAKRVGFLNLVRDPLTRPDRLEWKAIEKWRESFNRMREDAFRVAREVELAASRHLTQGMYPESVVYAQVSVEVFLNKVYAILCAAEGKTVLDDLPFMSMVKSEFPPRLGGNWAIATPGTPAGKWHQDTYVLRNRIIHAGYFPVLGETELALKAADEFREWVVSRILERRKRYPDLASHFQATG
jgi:hypothetical protein